MAGTVVGPLDDGFEKCSLLIAGPCGTGKSHLAQAIGHCAVRLDRDVLFTTQTRMLGQLHAARPPTPMTENSRP